MWDQSVSPSFSSRGSHPDDISPETYLPTKPAPTHDLTYLPIHKHSPSVYLVCVLPPTVQEREVIWPCQRQPNSLLHLELPNSFYQRLSSPEPVASF
ncbi:hypothetical protein HYQ46_000811 [Verticillium longisporum]|nr:hypothetical protein HYQ46_000811 [Verticillium longisporum]